ncbi:MAG TPA: GyrI-like domain-containing protein [Acidimicrobiia bacterium]
MDTQIIEMKSIASRQTAVIIGELEVDRLGRWLGEAFTQIAMYLEVSGNPPVGPPFARYHRLGERLFHVEAGFPVARAVAGSGRIQSSSLPGGSVAVKTHVGPYEEMEASYEALAKWIESRGGTPIGDAWEIYFSDSEDPPSTWRTEIFQPCQLN